mgnify:CR=1 FL=1
MSEIVFLNDGNFLDEHDQDFNYFLHEWWHNLFPFAVEGLVTICLYDFEEVA